MALTQKQLGDLQRLREEYQQAEQERKSRLRDEVTGAAKNAHIDRMASLDELDMEDKIVLRTSRNKRTGREEGLLPMEEGKGGGVEGTRSGSKG